MAAKPVPAGFHTVTPYLAVHDAAAAIDFYQKAFGAKVGVRMDTPNGKIGHAELKIGDSTIMLADEMPGMSTRSPRTLGGASGGVFLYVDDVDSAFRQATSAGAEVVMPLADMFWGDRYGQVKDPFGHVWSMATHKEDVAPEEMARRGREAMAKMAQSGQTSQAKG